MQKYAFVLEAGASQEFSIAATYVRVVSNVAVPALTVPAVRVANDNAEDFVLVGAAWARMDKQAKRLRFINETASQLTLTVIIGNGEYGDNNVNATITTSDQVLQSVVAGQEFLSVLFGSGANLYNAHTMRNPPGSGKNIIIDQLQVMGSIWLQQLRVGAGTGIAAPATGAVTMTYANAKVGGAAPVAALYQQTGTNITAPAVGNQVGSYTDMGDGTETAGDAWKFIDIVQDRPIVLPPDSVFQVQAVAANTGTLGFNTRWRWREQST